MKLKNIRLPIKEDDKRISSRKQYLCKIGGRWYANTFTKQHYGWNFDGVYDAGYQVDYDGWKKVYEIIT